MPQKGKDIIGILSGKIGDIDAKEAKKIKKLEAIEKLKQIAKEHLLKDESLHLQKSSDLRRFTMEEKSEKYLRIR